MDTSETAKIISENFIKIWPKKIPTSLIEHIKWRLVYFLILDLKDYIEESGIHQINWDHSNSTLCYSVDFDWDTLAPKDDDKDQLTTLIYLSNEIGFLHNSDKEYPLILSRNLIAYLHKKSPETKKDFIAGLKNTEPLDFASKVVIIKDGLNEEVNFSNWFKIYVKPLYVDEDKKEIFFPIEVELFDTRFMEIKSWDIKERETLWNSILKSIEKKVKDYLF